MDVTSWMTHLITPLGFYFWGVTSLISPPEFYPLDVSFFGTYHLFDFTSWITTPLGRYHADVNSWTFLYIISWMALIGSHLLDFAFWVSPLSCHLTSHHFISSSGSVFGNGLTRMRLRLYSPTLMPPVGFHLLDVTTLVSPRWMPSH